jgi:hypothetical protein
MRTTPPYFNNTFDLRKAYQDKYPDYSFDLISAMMVGAMSVYIPEEDFQKLIENASEH